MQDGIGQQGVGTSDIRLAGRDIQHCRQYSSLEPNRGLPGHFAQQDIHEALTEEQGRHRMGKEARISHLARHIQR